MSDEILNRIESKVDSVIKKLDDHDKIFEIVHGILTDILANLTEETGGDLAAALRKLTEAVNDLGTTVAANPQIIVSKIKNEFNV
jgi:predicted ArsR family transcriptional regulator